jgi:hypothetical protein
LTIFHSRREDIVRHTGKFFSSLLFLGIILFLSTTNRSEAFVYGRVGASPYPPDGTVTFMAYLSKGGETDNEVLTEDNMNCALGVDGGYFNQTFFVDWANFTNPGAQNNDTLVILFTGIGSQADSAGNLVSPINTGVGMENLGSSSWDFSSNPAIPTDLQASNLGPGIVSLSWTGAKNGTYRVYRCSQGSGAGNGASNGRYARLAKDLTSPSYVDSTAPLTMCWYIVVADDGGNLSGHTPEVSIDAALPVALSTFTARGDRDMVVLEWTTESEWNNLGFYIYRREETVNDFQRLTTEIIPGSGGSAHGGQYSWIDRRVELGRTYWYRLISEDLNGQTHIYGPVSASPVDAMPETFALSQNYPNPFNPETWIEYRLPERAQVSINIYNVAGQLVRQLESAKRPPGAYRTRWDGRDHNGHQAASGVYFCQMRTANFTRTVKMILLK